MQAGLAERREALEAIATGLAQQAEAVEGRLNRLTTLLSETLGTAEAAHHQRRQHRARARRGDDEARRRAADRAAWRRAGADRHALRRPLPARREPRPRDRGIRRAAHPAASARCCAARRRASPRSPRRSPASPRRRPAAPPACSAEALTDAEKRVAALNDALGEKAEEAARNAIGQFETMRLAAVSEGPARRRRRAGGAAGARREGARGDERLRRGASRRGGQPRQRGHRGGRRGDAPLRHDRRRAARARRRRCSASSRRRATSCRRACSKCRPRRSRRAPPCAAPSPSRSRRSTSCRRSWRGAPARRCRRRRRRAPAMPPATAPHGAGSDARADACASAPAGRARRAEPFGPSPSGAQAGVEASRETASKPAPTAASPGRRAAARASRARRNGEARGWVADLLRRASSDEPAKTTPAEEPEPRRSPAAGKRSPAQVVESLNSLSIDIARAIDHEASVELWDRYKRGERNVFTRRLYTLQGQKTFDELRAQIRARRRLPPRRRQLHRRLRAAALAGLEGRFRPDRLAHVSDLRHRQGLHHARARGGAAELGMVERDGALRIVSAW